MDNSSIIDKRNLTYDRLGATGGVEPMFNALASVGRDLGHELNAKRESANTFTGHLTELKPSGAPSALRRAQPASDSEFIQTAKAYVQSVRQAIGFAPTAPVEFEADSKVTRTSGETRIVSLQQTVNGIEVWGMEPKVWLNADGSVERVIGDTASLPPDLPAAPKVAAETALRVAAAAAAEERTKTDGLGIPFTLPALDLSGWTPVRTGQENRAARTTAFDNGPFEDIAAASLVYLYMGDRTKLAWRFIIARKFHSAQYLVLVDAEDAGAGTDGPEILYMQDLSSSAIGGHVFKHNPDEGGFTRVVFPMPVQAYPLPLPPGLPADFPLPWTEVTNGKLSTVGNNVLGLDGSTEKPYQVDAIGSGGDFEPQPFTPEQYVTNIFYFCNYMHNFFMMLGFDEANGNFQTSNVTGAGKGADPVHAFAHPSAVWGTASMATRADGLNAVMNMGLVTATGRHTANDADVVFHEFVHGVSKRLVGGMRDAQGLNEDQSAAMGEGWSDFFALSIHNYGRSTERVVTGSYATGRPGGIRQRPYDANYPGTFGAIGKGQGEVSADNALSYRQVHNVGEIWCATLMHLLRTMTDAIGDKSRAYQLTWQAVVDGMKLTPKNPTFLGARDAILKAFAGMKGKAIGAADYPAVQRAAWTAFAKFGMGVDASCANATFQGCRGGNQLPPEGWED